MMLILALLLVMVGMPFALYFGRKWGWTLAEWLDRRGWLP